MRSSIGLACVMLLFSSIAQALDFGVGAKAGINGVGLDTSVDFDAAVNAGGTNGLSQSELDSILRALGKDAEDELDDCELWPVLALGVKYAF